MRGHYAGYSDDRATFGIIRSNEVYLPTENEDGADFYKAPTAEDYEDGDDSGIFDTVVRIDFPPPDGTDNRYNNTIDIQAVVLDIAGNYGFSDSQASDPTFIHDYGTKVGPKPEDRDGYGVHNVLGWYSRHQYRLDDVDPEFRPKQSATGFFTDEDGAETASNSGLKVVFDGKIDEASVGVGTFVVKLDSGETATITDVDVDGKNVYLMLEETLDPDATPQVDLATGASILDLAGNESTDRRLEAIEVNDGILPTFTITLGGGSGLNEETDGEGPSELTNKQMTISIESNEDIQGAPQFSVVCSEPDLGQTRRRKRRRERSPRTARARRLTPRSRWQRRTRNCGKAQQVPPFRIRMTQIPPQTHEQRVCLKTPRWRIVRETPSMSPRLLPWPVRATSGNTSGRT